MNKTNFLNKDIHSGNGVPNHEAPTNTIYLDVDSYKEYINISSTQGISWELKDDNIYFTELSSTSSSIIGTNIPPCYRVSEIFCEEINGGTAGIIRIGSTSGAYDIVGDTEIYPSYYDILPISKYFFSITTSTTIFIQFLHNTSGAINLHFKLSKIRRGHVV